MEFEKKAAKSILDASKEFWAELLNLDVAIAGAGPSGLTAARYLAEKNLHVAVFEQHLPVGGGTWGKGTEYSEMIVEPEVRDILDNFGIKTIPVQGTDFYTVNPQGVLTELAIRAMDAGARIMSGVIVHDLIIRDNSVVGVVINGHETEQMNLHIDPLSINAKYVVDATGQEASLANILASKNHEFNLTDLRDKFMWAEEGEEQLSEDKKEIYPGLFATGMAANAVFEDYPMEAIFVDMLLSGRECAEDIAKRIRREY